jgi:2-oxoglutarate dehydrogenase E2 component (dihydrolipoamide succinyltransferase)
MAIVEVKVPQLSESVAEATMLQWKKKAGEAVAMDEILIEIETDKVVLEVPAPAAGVLSEIVVGDGGTVIGRPADCEDRYRSHGGSGGGGTAVSTGRSCGACCGSVCIEVRCGNARSGQAHGRQPFGTGLCARHRQGWPRHKG